MTTITRERIELFIKAPLENGLTRREQMELARIALLSLEAETVLYMNRFTRKAFTLDEQPGADKEPNIYVPLYAAPPAPVVPDGWISCSNAVPADFGDVILHDALGNVFPGSWDKVYCSIRGGYKTAFVDNDGIEVENVTHWMPLPEPPQEANQ